MTIKRVRVDVLLLESTETKPVENWTYEGMLAKETDTGRWFEFDESESDWLRFSASSVTVETATATVSNTTTETTIFTGAIPADSLVAGQVVNYDVRGVISNASAADDITIRVYIGATLLKTFNPAIGNVTNAVWDADGEFTVRSIGASGSLAFEGRTYINGNVERVSSIETVDTTVDEDLTVTVQWDNASASNTISMYQGIKEIRN